MHNFGEGLAIGQAAAASEIGLAVTLIIGFGLHNATEGFGICGPLSGEGIVPSWGLLGLLGLIGGAPTFFGTVVGQAWTSDAMSVVFFTVAGGSILYVVQELFAVNRKYGNPSSSCGCSSPGSCSASRRTSSSPPPASQRLAAVPAANACARGRNGSCFSALVRRPEGFWPSAPRTRRR